MDADSIRYWIDELRHYDPELTLFGSSHHRFALRRPIDVAELAAIENGLGFRLPHRDFLLHVGNGGAGPYYGIRPLTTDVLDRPSLRRPFALTQTWLPPDDDEDWDGVFDGLLYLADHGCAYQSFLVVAGPAAGQVWWDFTSVGEELAPEAESFEHWYSRWLTSSRWVVGNGRIRSIVLHERGWTVDARLLALRPTEISPAAAESGGVRVLRMLDDANLAVYRRDLTRAAEILSVARRTETDVDMSAELALVEAAMLRETGRTADALSIVDDARSNGRVWNTVESDLSRLHIELLLLLDRADEAVDAVEAYVARHPRDDIGYVRRALLRVLAGDVTGAVSALRRDAVHWQRHGYASAMNPDPDPVDAALRRRARLLAAECPRWGHPEASPTFEAIAWERTA